MIVISVLEFLFLILFLLFEGFSPFTLLNGRARGRFHLFICFFHRLQYHKRTPYRKKAKFMDIKAKIEEIVKKLQSDKTLLASFQSEPIKTVEKLLDIDLPDEMIEKVVESVKAKIKVDDVKGILDGVKGLFGK